MRSAGIYGTAVVAAACVLAVFAVLPTALAAPRLESLNFQVEPKSEDCLYQDIEVSSKVKTNVLVTRGGKLDIKYRVTGPDNIVLHEKMVFSNVNDETGQVTHNIMKKHFDFVAHQSGEYAFCFNNQMSRWTAKVVDMEFIVEPNTDTDGAIADAEPGKPSPVGGMEKRVAYLDRMLDKVINAQIYHRKREEANRDTAESNNSRVMWFSLLEACVLVGASAMQLYVVRTWFPALVKRSGV